jgi:hypothetical protein
MRGASVLTHSCDSAQMAQTVGVMVSLWEKARLEAIVADRNRPRTQVCETAPQPNVGAGEGVKGRGANLAPGTGNALALGGTSTGYSK